MRLELINGLRLLIVAFLSYVPTVSFAGWFEAWVAKKMGDDIPEQAGFLTFNPFVHFNIVGFGALLVGIFFGQAMPLLRGIPGWGQHVPISPSVLMGGNRNFRVVAEFIGRSIGHFILMFISFLIMISVLNVSMVYTGTPMIVTEGTSLVEALRFIVFFFFQQNSILFVIYCIIGVFHSIVFFFLPDLHYFSTQTMLWTIAILLLAIFIGSPLLELFLHNFFMLIESIFVAG